MRSVTVRVVGVDDLQDAFDALRRDFLVEANVGFLPLARLRGRGGEPWTVMMLQKIAKRKGFVTGTSWL